MSAFASVNILKFFNSRWVVGSALTCKTEKNTSPSALIWNLRSSTAKENSSFERLSPALLISKLHTFEVVLTVSFSVVQWFLCFYFSLESTKLLTYLQFENWILNLAVKKHQSFFVFQRSGFCVELLVLQSPVYKMVQQRTSWPRKKMRRYHEKCTVTNNFFF